MVDAHWRKTALALAAVLIVICVALSPFPWLAVGVAGLLLGVYALIY